MAAQFVETSETDAISALLRHIDHLRSTSSGATTTAAYDDAAPYLSDNRYPEVLRQVCQLHPVLFTESEKETEEAMNVVCLLLYRALQDSAQDKAQASKLVEQFVTSLTSAAEPYPTLRFKILSSAFNLIDERHPARSIVFSALLRYAALTGNAEAVVVLLDRVEGWFEEWGTDRDGRRAILLAISQALAKGRGRQALAHSYLLKHLGELQGAGEASLAQAQAQAVEAVVAAISVTDVYQFELYLQLDAIKSLSKGANSKLLDLLVIFASKSLQDFVAFDKANPAVLKTFNLEREACVHKMRLLSICTLAAANRELSYEEVSAAIEVDAKEVEHWIIRTISAKLIDARMDQPRRRLIINSATERVFSDAQWVTLQSRLVSWRDGVSTLVQSVRRVREDLTEQQQHQQQ